MVVMLSVVSSVIVVVGVMLNMVWFLVSKDSVMIIGSFWLVLVVICWMVRIV